MRFVKYTAIALLVVFAGIQFIRPSRANPPVDPGRTIQSATTVPADVDRILRRSCYDCHSSETTWPWYSQVAPMSWLVADHVKEGRGELSFSEFATYEKKKATKKLGEACEEIEKGAMPLESYLLLHPSAKLSDADRQVLCSWFRAEQAKLGGSAAEGESDSDRGGDLVLHRPPSRR